MMKSIQSVVTIAIALIIQSNVHQHVSSFIIPRKNVRIICPSSSSPSSSLSSSSSSTKNEQPIVEKKAGEEGYSILRQPLNWDSESDPRFDAPKSLDASKEENYKTRDADWFQSRILGDVGTGVKNNINENNDNNNNNQSSVAAAEGNHHRTEEFDQEINLTQRTLDTLDYPIVLKALLAQCETIPAQSIIGNAIDENKSDDKVNNVDIHTKMNQKRRKKLSKDDVRSLNLTANDVNGIHDRYDAIKEMNAILNNRLPTRKQIGRIPLSNCDFNIQPMLEKIDRGEVLDGPDILEVSTILQSSLKVGDWCMKLDKIERQRKKQEADKEQQQSNNDSYIDYDSDDLVELKQLPKFGQSIYIDDELVSLLDNAFDDEGRLSGTTFPSIGRLRAKVRTLKNDILSTLDMIMASPSMKSKVSLESGGAVYSEVNGRIVIPIADKYKNSVGIIHDQSRSGKTTYVEPTEIVRPTNEMRGAEMELRQEEMKVWRRLTREIKENRDDIEKSIASVAQLDLVMARIRLGDILEGVVPEVGNEGIISLKDARHPVLLLRGLDNVVGSDIDIGAGKNQGLVLTGPNSGGKTVILKLMGLCALMARDGIPVPAKSKKARVDFFNPVLADIGDLQSVDGDLSTFSGHMLVCREVLANSGKNALVLMG